MRGDLEWGTIPKLAQLSATRFGEAEAVVDRGQRVTFGELAAAMNDAARAAIATGVVTGDRVAIWAPNSLEWIVAALGVMAAGGCVVPVNTRFKGEEAAWVLGRSGASLLFTVNGFLGTDYTALLRGANVDLPSLREIVLLDGDPVDGTTGWRDYIARGETVPAASAAARLAAGDGCDVSDIIFTSGTTGRPKGVMTTHAQNLRAFADYTAAIGLREGDRYLIISPFFHAFGFKAGWLACLMRGATAYPQPHLDLDEVLARIERERITVLPGPPTLLLGILNHPDRVRYDLSSLRLTATGAATIPVELIRRLREERLFDVVLTAYGLTESSGLVSVSAPDDSPETVAHWSGRVTDGIEVCVLDEGGQRLPCGGPGEILVRGYNVTQGYFADPEQTAATIDEDNWLHTGDIGVIDERGYIQITDRKKDMFIVGGFNAYPAEIENLLLGFDKIAQVAVVGTPDERLGEVGVAFVVPRREVDADEVIAYARSHMANYKVPRHVEIVSALPLNAMGKVVKDVLRERARQP